MNETAFSFQRVMHRCFFVSVCSHCRQMCHPVRGKIIFCLSGVQKSDELFVKTLSHSWSHLGDYLHPSLCGAKQLIWPPFRNNSVGGKRLRIARRVLPCTGPYTASSGIWCRRCRRTAPHIPTPPGTRCCEWPGWSACEADPSPSKEEGRNAEKKNTDV